MADMSVPFEMTYEAEELLFGGKIETEYVVSNPITIEVALKSGEVLHPQEIRERVVRCRYCKHATPCPLADSEKLICELLDEMLVSSDGFCSWGEGREA